MYDKSVVFSASSAIRKFRLTTYPNLGLEIGFHRKCGQKAKCVNVQAVDEVKAVMPDVRVARIVAEPKRRKLKIFRTFDHQIDFR